MKVRNIERIILYPKKIEKERALQNAKERVEDEVIRAEEEKIRKEIGITDE